MVCYELMSECVIYLIDIFLNFKMYEGNACAAETWNNKVINVCIYFEDEINNARKVHDV